MDRFIVNQIPDPVHSELSHSCNEAITIRPHIKKCLHREFIFTNPYDYIRQKRIKNNRSLYEQEAFLVPFSKVRKHLLASTRSSSQKQTMCVHLEFNTLSEVIKILSRILPKHSNLRGLYIFLHEEVGFDIWRTVGRLISKFSHINAVQVRFLMKKPELDKHQLAKLHRGISRIPGLINLGMGLTQPESNVLQTGFAKAGFISDTNNNTEGLLYKLMARLKNLKSVELKNTRQDWNTDLGITLFGKALSEHPKIQDVSLKLYDCVRITNQGLNAYLDYIQTNPQLKKLAMVFKISNDCIDTQSLPILHPIWTNQKLEYISMEIKFESLFPPEAFDAVITGIEKIRCLGKLSLDFYGTAWDSSDAIHSIPKLAFLFSTLSSLTDLIIRFIHCPSLDYASANNLIYALNSCPHLKKATLEFLSCFKKIYRSTEEIEAPMISCLNLKELNLGFVNCAELEEKQIDKIVELLIHCENLEVLNLQVAWCKSFVDEHYQKFIKAISAMKFLQRMTLGFEGSNQITKNSAMPFGKMLTRLSLLTYLDLNFSYFPDISDDRISNLAGWVSELKYLETLKLNLKGCKLVTDEGIKTFCYALKGSRKLGVMILTWNSINIRALSQMLTGQLAAKLPNLYCIEFHGIKKNGQTSKVCVRLIA